MVAGPRLLTRGDRCQSVTASSFFCNTGRSRNKLIDIAAPVYKLLPAASRQRGLAAIGLELESPVALIPIPAGPTVVRCEESRDGKPIGELSVEVFKAALVIDRDGILMEKVAHVAPPVAVTLPGASGFRASGEQKDAPLRFVHVFAIAPHDLGVDGGVLVTVRSATRDWPSADKILRSLKVFGRRPATANDGNALTLTLVGDDD